MRGTAESGTEIDLFEDNTLLGEALTNDKGNWSLIPTEQLPVGVHTIVAVDVATGDTSVPVTFTLMEPWLPVTGGERCP